MSPTGDLEYLHFFSPSMWPSDALKPELTPARESLDNETVSNSASNHVEDEQNISEDNMKTFLDDIQEVTDSFITSLNALQKEKEVEILDK